MIAATTDAGRLARRIGAHRSLDPTGALPHVARRLDAGAEANEHEAELEVTRLNIDATSFADLRRRAGDDPAAIADTIAAIVAEHGKLQNPSTGSGGVLLGRVRSTGAARDDGLVVGEAVVPLASLIAIPLALDEVGPVDVNSPQVPVRGRAIVTGAMVCGRVPGDLPQAAWLSVVDVYPAASHVRDLARPGDTVLVLGSGHAGLLAVAAARRAVGPEGTVAAVDLTAAALALAARADPGAICLRADVTDAVSVAAGLAGHGVGPADLVVQCATAAGAEGAALLAAAPRGTVLFFSTATAFASAALGADPLGSQCRLLIPAGLTDDRGDYALELVRTVPALRQAFGA